MKAQSCSAHHYVTNQLGAPLSRQCVYCGAGPLRRLVEKITAVVPGKRSRWHTDVAARAAWDAVNEPISDRPEESSKGDRDAA